MPRLIFPLRSLRKLRRARLRRKTHRLLLSPLQAMPKRASSRRLLRSSLLRKLFPLKRTKTRMKMTRLPLCLQASRVARMKTKLMQLNKKKA